jgi:hypothetical protein
MLELDGYVINVSDSLILFPLLFCGGLEILEIVYYLIELLGLV